MLYKNLFFFCKNHLTDPGKFWYSTFRSTTREKILNNTEISNLHLTPEISLRLITNNCKIYNQPIIIEEDKIFENDPFWGIYWPGGQVLSRYILDNPSIVKSKKVLDIGSGSGACAIAASLSGAEMVISNDIDKVAVIAALMNAEINNTKIYACTTDLIGKPLLDDIILLGDIFYDDQIVDLIIPWLLNLKNNKKTIFIGDPGRHPLKKNCLKYMKKLKTYNLPHISQEENFGFKNATIWEWVGSRN